MRPRPWGVLLLASVACDPSCGGGKALPAHADLQNPRFERPFLLRTDRLDAASRAEGEAALRRMREDWSRTSDRPFCKPAASQFQAEWREGWTELRLFTLGYPELAEAWAQRAAEDPAFPRFEKGAAYSVLGWLAEARWGAARSVLLRCRKESLDDLGVLAIHLLDRADGIDARRRFDREAAISDDGGRLEATLRHRLQEEYESGHVERGRSRMRVRSETFDETLLALAEIGGELTAEEQAYLRFYGYGVDPRRRLAEILSDKWGASFGE